MHLPAEASQLTLLQRVHCPYPPIGFHFLEEHELANGDAYGLYWPIGREARPPLVMETYHDEWTVGPVFSSIRSFLDAESRSESEHYVDWPTLDEDPHSPELLLTRARELQKADELYDALSVLEAALEILPEFTEARALSVAIFRRLDQFPEAMAAAVAAIRSPRCLGDAAPAAAWLARQPDCSELAGDPIFENRTQISLKFGGTKINLQYVVLLDAINRYEDNGDFIAALSLLQAYGEFMIRETTAFQERYEYSDEWFRDRYQELCAEAQLPDRTTPS